jgi:prepilin peptidase CpaA
LAGGAVFALLLGMAVASDIRSFRIPNWQPAALVAALIVVRVGGGQAMDLPVALAVGMAVLVAGFVLYVGGFWGGGDAKLLAAVAAWAGLDGLPRLLLVTAVAGGLLAGLVLMLRRRRGQGASDWASLPMPYGVAIAFGGYDWALGMVSTFVKF